MPELRTKWDNRIVRREDVDPETLTANPANFRSHGEQQARELKKVLDKIGWVEDVIVNQSTGHVVDGHLRVGLAIARGERTVPVAYVELSEEDEKAALVALDQITAMAVKDDAALVGLLDDVGGDAAQLVGWLRSEGKAAPQPSQEQIDRTTEQLNDKFRKDGGPQGVELECPECGQHFGIAGIGVTS